MQCGYCTPGMIMSAIGLLHNDPHPTREAIIEHMQGNICRCGCYPRIIEAVQHAAKELPAEGKTDLARFAACR
jgi:isoquinoline 1-oxidoreductase alpha subunit